MDRTWRSAILVVGDELIAGRTRDSNGSLLARLLTEAGLPPREIRTVPDETAGLERAARELLKQADLILVSGGLGPTEDDRTRPALAAAAGQELEESPELVEGIRERMARWGRAVRPPDLRQAQLPRGARPIPNPVGSAPGFTLTVEGRVLAALPGVPVELEAMAPDAIRRALEILGEPPPRPVTRSLSAAGIPEAEIQDRIDRLGDLGGAEIASYPRSGQITLRITAPDEAGADRAARKIAQALGGSVFARGEIALEVRVGELLRQRRQTLALAESCTGGLIGHRLTEVPGSSDYLDRGLVVYSNRAKIELLGVSPDLLREHGAVSAPVAEAMAAGCRERSGTDWALAVTGVAGPGASQAKPAGTVHLALASPSGISHHRLQLGSTRSVVKQVTATLALDMLRRALEEEG